MEQDQCHKYASMDTANQHSKNVKFNNCFYDTVFIPTSIHDRNISSRHLKHQLKNCLEHIVIKIHEEIFERMTGILQGSICSRNLCDLYLGRIERKLFTYEKSEPLNEVTNQQNPQIRPFKLDKSNEIVLRNVDDYLVISSDYERLINIKDIIKSELKLNEKKTVVYKWTSAPRKISIQHNDEILEDSDLEIVEILPQIDSGLSFSFLENHSKIFFSWCGFNIDVKTLDIYLNYDKYFDDSASLKNRLNSSDAVQTAFIQFNLRFQRLFTVNISNILIDIKVNSVQAFLRNCVDLFALSVIRFMLLYKIMPNQLTKNTKLQLKLILNLCYWLNNRISYGLMQRLLNYFYTCLSLLKYLCLKTYEYLIENINVNGTSASKKHAGFLKVIKKVIEKLSFKRCLKFNCDHFCIQIDKLIEEQCEKFTQCKI